MKAAEQKGGDGKKKCKEAFTQDFCEDLAHWMWGMHTWAAEITTEVNKLLAGGPNKVSPPPEPPFDDPSP
jgi:hypothetical protein